MQLDIKPLSNWDASESGIYSVHCDCDVDLANLGKVSVVNGLASFKILETAIEAALQHKIQTLVTGPISKEAWHRAGLSYTGHTSLLQSKTGASQVSMAFHTKTLKTVLATIHVPLSEVPSLIDRPCLNRAIQHSLEFSQLCGLQEPHIAVAGLNPHAGEGGLFGGEEEVIQAVIEEWQLKGVNLSGPLPADTLYYRAHNGDFDMVVSLYHDQGLIPIKLIGFHEAVNVTLGLPFIRTSPDHGTAFDIAYQDKANHHSFLSAVTLATTMRLSSVAY